LPTPILPTPPVQSVVVNEKKDELLLDVNEEEPIEHNNNTSNGILDDLNDLTFEQYEKENTGKKQSSNISSTINNNNLDLLSLPLPSNDSS
jgi:hypothetical protein